LLEIETGAVYTLAGGEIENYEGIAWEPDGELEFEANAELGIAATTEA